MTPTTEPSVFKIWGKAYFVQYTVPQKFTSISLRITLRSKSLNIALIEIPALLTSMSILPNLATACSIRFLQSSSRETSALTGSTSVMWESSASISLRRSEFLAAKTSFAPSAANSLAAASPIPELAPVIITTLSFNILSLYVI